MTDKSEQPRGLPEPETLESIEAEMRLEAASKVEPTLDDIEPEFEEEFNGDLEEEPAVEMPNLNPEMFPDFIGGAYGMIADKTCEKWQCSPTTEPERKQVGALVDMCAQRYLPAMGRKHPELTMLFSTLSMAWGMRVFEMMNRKRSEKKQARRDAERPVSDVVDDIEELEEPFEEVQP